MALPAPDSCIEPPDTAKDPLRKQLDYVRAVARGVAQSRSAWEHLEDLMSVGLETLLRLAQDRPEFIPFSRKRIEGAMLDYLRKERRQSHASLGISSMEERPDEALLPDQQIREFQRSQRLREAFEVLPDEERDVLRLRFEEGCTQSEAGRCRGSSRQKIQRLESRALKSMRPWVEVARAA